MSVAREEIIEGSIIRIPFTTHDKNGGAVAPSSAFEAGDVRIYKDDSNTQKTTTNGVTIESPKDSITGLHFIRIDTSNDSGDAGFWVAGGQYSVVLIPTSETVDSETVVKVIGSFRIFFTPELIHRYNGAIHFSGGGGSTAVIGIDGTPLLPTAQVEIANTLSNNTGIPVIRIGSTFTVDRNLDSKIFEGLDNSGNFHGAAGFTLNNCILRNIIISNGQLGDNTTNILVENSTITNFGASLNSGKFNKCIFEEGSIFGRNDGGIIQLVNCDNLGPSPVMLRADFGAEFRVVNFRGDLILSGSTFAGKVHKIHMQGGHLMIQFQTTGASFLMITGYGVLDDQSGPNFYVDTTGFFDTSKINTIVNSTGTDIPNSLSSIEAKIDIIDANVDLIKDKTDIMTFTTTNLDVNIKMLDDDVTSAQKAQKASEASYTGTVGAGAHSTSQILASTITGFAANAFINKTFNLTSGAAEGCGAVIESYNEVTGAFTFKAGFTLQATPSNGDKIVIQ